jgi:oxygen-independent coproporphyrinogen-3 oxidase
MKAEIITRYDRQVPRYTSYPTAPHFGPQVGERTYRDWLSALDPTDGISLYSHVPFCESLCWFCGCHTKIVRRFEPVATYLDALYAEMGLVADALPARAQVRHMHWGGGSPTLLRPDDWRRAAETLHAHFDFAPDAEIAVEMDPRTATEDGIAAMAEMGVNRASIGVQDFDLRVQRAINRIQPFEVTARVIDWLGDHGIDEINMDLMYGLPYQTVAGVASMVDKAVFLRPDRVAVFGYAHVPWMKRHQKLIPEEALPDAGQRWAQCAAISERLIAAGYVAIGLDHFALPENSLAIAQNTGTLRRNFQGYTTDTAAALIGFGASAIGKLPQGYAQNAAPLAEWRKAVEAGQLPIVRGAPLSWEDNLRGAVIERLMCDFRVDLADLRSRHLAPPGFFSSEIAALAPLVADQLVELDGEHIQITSAGQPLVRVAASLFDSYMTPDTARHARAV